MKGGEGLRRGCFVGEISGEVEKKRMWKEGMNGEDKVEEEEGRKGDGKVERK